MLADMAQSKRESSCVAHEDERYYSDAQKLNHATQTRLVFWAGTTRMDGLTASSNLILDTDSGLTTEVQHHTTL
jgi:hypothetical protein